MNCAYGRIIPLEIPYLYAKGPLRSPLTLDHHLTSLINFISEEIHLAQHLFSHYDTYTTLSNIDVGRLNQIIKITSVCPIRWFIAVTSPNIYYRYSCFCNRLFSHVIIRYSPQAHNFNYRLVLREFLYRKLEHKTALYSMSTSGYISYNIIDIFLFLSTCDVITLVIMSDGFSDGFSDVFTYPVLHSFLATPSVTK